MHWVGDELKDVALGNIIRPANRQWHTTTMPADMMRVQYNEVLPGYEQLEPPSQPWGWDDDGPAAVLGTGFQYMFQWPKSQIRLGTDEGPSQHNNVIADEPAHAEHDQDAFNMAQNQDDDEDDYIDPAYADQFLISTRSNERRISDMYEPAKPAAKPTCQVRLFPNSQETPPPATFTEPPRPAVPLADLRRVVGETQQDTGRQQVKKARKRPAKKGSKQADPPVFRAQDGPAFSASRPKLHVAGVAMMSKPMLEAAGSYMRNLHECCLYIETRRIREKDPSYLVMMAKVPARKELCFVHVSPGDIFFVRHTDIFDLLNGYRLHDTLVRLFSLNMSMAITRDNLPLLQVADPYFFRDAVLGTEEGIEMAAHYLAAFMERYSDRTVILVAYHPTMPGDRQGCVLICLNMKRSTALYLDSSSAIRKDFTRIKSVLDGALTTYVAHGGAPPETPHVNFGAHVFKHQMNFDCAKQPANSNKDAFYAIHHMKQYAHEVEQLTLPSDVVRWGERLSTTPDPTLRQAFFEIQEDIATIMHNGVNRLGGMFYGGNQPANKAIDERLALQGDGRMMTMLANTKKGLLHAGPDKPTTSSQKEKQAKK
jgi:hypothetical protein